MIELLVIYWLCRKNSQEALISGHRPEGYVVLTIAMWFGMEALGLFLGLEASEGFIAYIFAILFAVIGGAVSNSIVKNLKAGNYIATVKSKPLEGAAQIKIIREGSATSSSAGWDFFLNGESLGRIDDGVSVTFPTNQRNNVLVARMDCGAFSLPYKFSVENGGSVGVHFKACKFEKAQKTDTPSVTLDGSAVQGI